MKVGQITLQIKMLRNFRGEGEMQGENKWVETGGRESRSYYKGAGNQHRTGRIKSNSVT